MDYSPQKTVRAYKLFRKKGDQIYPLYVGANKPVPMGKWLKAEAGQKANDKGQVKSRLGPLAFRPGWHSGDYPVALHIGGKSNHSLNKPDYRPDEHVWAEVDVPADHDWQSVANSRGKGVKAHIIDQVPYNGHYRYKTNPNMHGNWIISGNIKVNRILSDDEVQKINSKTGVHDLPRRKKISESFLPDRTQIPNHLLGKSRSELEGMDTDELDRAAWGHASGDRLNIHPNNIKIKYPGDLDNPREKFRSGGMNWVKSVNFKEPIQLSIDKEGKYNLEDGHHRYFAASKLNRHIPAEISKIDGNPVSEILRRQGIKEVHLVGDYSVHRSIQPVDKSYRYEVRHKGKPAGFSSLETGNKKVFYTIIKPEHQRRGVATALYKHIEKDLGHQLDPSDEHTAMGAKFRAKYEKGRSLREIFLKNKEITEVKKLNEPYPIYSDTTAKHVLNLAKQHNIVRFVVTPDNKIHASSASYNTHNDIHEAIGSYRKDQNNSLEGYVTHRNGEYKHIGFIDGNIQKNHPFMQKLTKLGSKEDINIAENLNELKSRTVISYLNKAQDAHRYFSDSKKLSKRLDSFVLAQKKIGQSKERPKVMARFVKEDFEELKPKIHQNVASGTLKHLVKNSPSKTMKFYISSGNNMYSGDSYHYTHHSLGAATSNLWGGITYHPDDDSFHYAAHKYKDGNYPEASHEILNRLENNGVKRGVWNYMTGSVDKRRVQESVDNERLLNNLYKMKFKTFLTENVLGPDRILNHSKTYTHSVGLPDVRPEMQISTHEKQYPIARAFHVAASEDPEYKQHVFNAYKEQHPDLIKSSGATDYDSLKKASYGAMEKETQGQYDTLSKHINFEYHGGNKDYENSNAMRADLHNNNHMDVFNGGERHEFLNHEDSNGINSNHKFRAVHDAFGHGILKNGFGPKGEETAWHIHSQMYSPLARPAMTAETRGQNSWVNYSGVNAGRSPKDTTYAPQKAVLLPPEMNRSDYNGEIPHYLRKHM